jgi:hypothetical protein
VTVFQDVLLCSLIETDQHFKDDYCLYLIVVIVVVVVMVMVMMMIMMEVEEEAVSAFETFVNFCETTWHNIPEDSHLHTLFCENLKSCCDDLFLGAILAFPYAVL